MRKVFLFALFLFAISFSSYAQDTIGMVAHWPMNGNCNDISHNGNHGKSHNIVADTGKSGRAGTAYYFDGSDSSYISVPYKADLNISKYSICATIKVAGFYTGLCQANTILSRGKPGSSGCYTLLFFDQAADNSDCNYIDTTKDVFAGWAGNNDVEPVSSWQYDSTIRENKWYSVVLTYDSVTYKIYVDGLLINSVTPITHNPISATTDSLAIGLNIFEAAAGFPYSFKGKIDDVRLYNRALDVSEVITYTTSTLADTMTDTTTHRLSIHQLNLNTVNVAISPNPAKDFVTLNISKPLANASLSIFNQLGQEMKTSKITSDRVQINISDLPAGMYFIRILSGDESITNKFLKE